MNAFTEQLECVLALENKEVIQAKINWLAQLVTTYSNTPFEYKLASEIFPSTLRAMQKLGEKTSFIDIERIEKIAHDYWQQSKLALAAGSIRQAVHFFKNLEVFLLEIEIYIKFLLEAKHECEENSRTIYSLFQQLQYQLRKAEVTINWIEREFPKCFLIEEYERLEVIKKFEEDFNNFANCVIKQYVTGEFIAVREALKSKEEQCSNYLNTLKAISQLPDKLYQQLIVKGNSSKINL